MKIIDVCCGGKMWWFDKGRDDVIFMDKRTERKGFIDERGCTSYEVNPDLEGDFTNIPFDDETFFLVVCDPPHKIKKDSGLITKKYGFLGENWEEKLKLMFEECWRILKPNGTLIIKWADVDIPPRKVLSCFSQKMLIGTHTKKGVNNSYFWTFFKGE